MTFSKFYQSLLVLLIFMSTTDMLSAQIRRIRAVYNFDPATQITIGFENVSGTTGALGPKLYFSQTDHGIDLNAYAADNPPMEITEQIFGRGMNNAFFEVMNLTPGTNYYFVISDGTTTTPRYYVKTIPNDNNCRLKIIAGGDSRNAITLGPDAATVPARVAANTLVSKMRADAIFFGGDMTLQDTEPEWFIWLDHWELTFAEDGYITPIVPARGNHEYFITSVYEIFRSPNQNSVYGVKFADDLLHLSTLNSETTILGNPDAATGQPVAGTISVEDQGLWLETELAENACTYWRMAQYHRPTRPHESSKSLRDNQREAWSKRFDKYAVQVVCESDAHVTKYTHPIRAVESGFVDPVTGFAEDEGFVRDDLNGVTYIGEGGWGAELRPNTVVRYDWTIADAAFNQYKLIFIDKEKMIIRNIITDDAENYEALGANEDRFDMTKFEDSVWEYEPGKKTIVVTNVTPPTTEPTITTTVLSNGQFELDAGADYKNYSWSTGETTQKIVVTNTGDYTVTVSNRALCEQSKTTTVSNEALAVEMLDFVGKEYGATNLLTWTTANEITNDFFVVEAATDGQDFIALGQLSSAGESRATQTYNFIDESPLAKRTYYRLQQVDVAGRVTYSDIISVEREADFVLQVRRIVPNPVAEDARLQFVANSTKFVDYQVVNAAGQLQLQQQIQPIIGNNEVPVATADLPAGIYFVVLKQGNEQVSYRFIKK